MPQLEVNVDVFAYHGPAPREGAPRPLLFAERCQVVDLPDDEAERARTLLVGQVYPDPLGGAGVVRRLEPAGVEAGAKSAGEDEVARWNEERARLRAELARLEANAPLVARAAPAPITSRADIPAPALPPSITGVRNLPPMVGAAFQPAARTEEATTGAPAAPSIDVSTSSAERVVAYVNQYPEQLDAVEAAEQGRRGGPRRTVTEVIETHRRRTAEREGAGEGE